MCVGVPLQVQALDEGGEFAWCADGARRELQNAIGRMGEEARRRRLDTLLAKEQETGLSVEEKRDLQALMSGKI